MKNRNYALIGLLLILGCTATASPKLYSFFSENGQTQNISVAELDLRARDFVSKEWGQPRKEINDWKLQDAQYRNDLNAFTLTYKRKITAPLVIVLFDNLELPEKILGYK